MSNNNTYHTQDANNNNNNIINHKSIWLQNGIILCHFNEKWRVSCVVKLLTSKTCIAMDFDQVNFHIWIKIAYRVEVESFVIDTLGFIRLRYLYTRYKFAAVTCSKLQIKISRLNNTVKNNTQWYQSNAQPSRLKVASAIRTSCQFVATATETIKQVCKHKLAEKQRSIRWLLTATKFLTSV